MTKTRKDLYKAAFFVLLGLALGFATAGCTHELGNRIDMSAASSFKPGITTLDEAKAALGNPYQIRTGAKSGRQQVDWVHVSVGQGKGATQKVSLIFNANGVLEREVARIDSAVR